MAQNDVIKLTICMTVGNAPTSFCMAYRQTSATVPGDDDTTSICATQFGVDFANIVSAISTQSRLEEIKAELVDGIPHPPGRIVFVDSPGVLGGQALPPQKCCLIELKQTTTNVRSNGKTFLSGLAENSTDGSTIVSAAVLTNLQTVFDNVINMTANPAEGQYDYELVVLGARPAVGIPHPVYPVTSVVVKSILANQKRRRTPLQGASLQ